MLEKSEIWVTKKQREEVGDRKWVREGRWRREAAAASLRAAQRNTKERSVLTGSLPQTYHNLSTQWGGTHIHAHTPIECIPCLCGQPK